MGSAAVIGYSPEPIDLPDDLGHRLGFEHFTLERRAGGPIDGAEVPACYSLRVSGDFPEAGADEEEVRALMGQVASDVVIVPGEMAWSSPSLIVTDVDSTLISQEVIEELAHYAGTREQVAAVTARAMNGEIDFAESLRERVATLEGVSESVFAQVLETVTPTPGVDLLIRWQQDEGGQFGVVSGGFTEVVAPLCQRLGIDHYVANHLEVRDGRLTGRVTGEIVTSDTKVEALRRWAAEMGAPLSTTVAIGDGANDVPMMQTAGLGVAFRAKPAVREQVPDSLSFPRLDAMIAAFGSSEDDVFTTLD